MTQASRVHSKAYALKKLSKDLRKAAHDFNLTLRAMETHGIHYDVHWSLDSIMTINRIWITEEL